MSSSLLRNLGKVRGLKHPWQIAIFVVLIGITLWVEFDEEKDPEVSRGVTSGMCVNVIDGDTLDVEPEGGGERLRIRLLGIDTMETHNEEKMSRQAAQHGRDVREIRALGERARDTVRDLALNMRVDWEVPHGTPIRDPHGRVLAYVSVEGRDVGEYLLGQGLAEVRGEPHPRSGRYRQAAKPLQR